MRAARRWYVYIMSFAALIALSAGVLNLTYAIIASLLGLGMNREHVATWAGVIVVSLPLFVVHALWANRLARDPEERGASLRKLYTYATAGLGTFLLSVFITRGLQLSLKYIFGDPSVLTLQHTPTLPLARMLQHIAGAAWGGTVLWYALLLVRRDADIGKEVGIAATWRRLYVVLTGIVGLVWLTFTTIDLLHTLLLVLVPPVAVHGLSMGAWWRTALANTLGAFLVALALWYFAWDVEGRWFQRHPRERGALSRQAFYYVGVALGLSVFLVSLAFLLRQGVLGILGEGFGPRYRWWPDMATALAGILVGACVWMIYRARLEREEFFSVQAGRTPIVGRLYMYIASGIALAASWWGAVTLINLVTRALVVHGYTLNPGWWRRPLATGIALLIVALPTWWWHWHQIQDRARPSSLEGRDERRSLVRRVYLYGISLVAGLVVLVYLARVARALWLRVLGVYDAPFLEGLANALGPSLTAAAAWAYHMWVLRLDARDREATPEETIAALKAERERLLQRLSEIESTLEQLEKEAVSHGGDTRESP